MPLYEFRCEKGHAADVYVHVPEDKGCETRMCSRCKTETGDECSMGPALSLGSGLTWAEEGRPRVLWNLGPEPVTITSHEQHKTEMRKRGLDWATRGRGEAGSWV